MAVLNDYGFLERKVGKKAKRDWWLVKARGIGHGGVIPIKVIYLPRKYLGKRVRLRLFVEEMSEIQIRDNLRYCGLEYCGKPERGG